MRRSMVGCFLLFVMGIVPHSLRAQVAYGTILGGVTDASGAAVPQANITVVNMKTSVANTVKVGGAGDYSVGNLFPGEYQVTVEAEGFSTFVASHLVLLVDQKLRVDAVLRPGAVTTQVVVTSVAQLVDTDSSTVGKVVENEQIENMPLVSRNFVELAALSPGVVSQPAAPAGINSGEVGTLYTGAYWRTALAGGTLWVGGGREDQNQWYIDGTDNNDPGFQTPAVTPPIDSIQEFKIMTKDYSAEFGGAQAQVAIAIKSGTNAFHGTAYDFFRNDVLDARGFFDTVNPQTGRSKPQLRYNQFGGTLGGPIKRNKWFFFGGYEGTRNHDLGFERGIVPTTAELSGNFSALSTPIYNFKTGQPYAGNIVPVNAKIQQLLSDPYLVPPNISLPGGINLAASTFNVDTISEVTARVDGKITDRDSLFVRVSIQNETLNQPSIYPLNGLAWVQDGRNAAVGYDHTFSAHLINEFRVGYLRPLSREGQQTGGQCYAQALLPASKRTRSSAEPPLRRFPGSPPTAANPSARLCTSRFPRAWLTP